MHQKGFLSIPIAIIVSAVLITAVGAGFYVKLHKPQPVFVPSPSPTQSPVAVNTQQSSSESTALTSTSSIETSSIQQSQTAAPTRISTVITLEGDFSFRGEKLRAGDWYFENFGFSILPFFQVKNAPLGDWAQREEVDYFWKDVKF